MTGGAGEGVGDGGEKRCVREGTFGFLARLWGILSHFRLI